MAKFSDEESQNKSLYSSSTTRTTRKTTTIIGGSSTMLDGPFGPTGDTVHTTISCEADISFGPTGSGILEPITRQEVLSVLSNQTATLTKVFNDYTFKFLLQQLRNNTVTTNLEFEIPLDEKHVSELIQMLETNKTLLHITLCYNDPNTAFNKSIKYLLEKNSYLQGIYLKYDDSLLTSIAEAMQNNNSLQSINCTVFNPKVQSQGIIALAEILKKNSSLKSISIACDDAGAKALAEALEVNTGLQKLALSCSKIGDEGAKALAGALEGNKGLQKLDLSFNHDITEAVLTYFCCALEVNETLETLEIFNKNIKSYVDAKYLRSSECKYKPYGSSIKREKPKTPPANDDSFVTEEKHKDDNNQRLEVNPLDEQQADGSPFSLSTPQEALPPAGTPESGANNAPLEPMGENSGQTEGEGDAISIS